MAAKKRKLPDALRKNADRMKAGEIKPKSAAKGADRPRPKKKRRG